MAPILSLLALGAVVLNGVSAHPGHSVAEEAAERASWLRSRQPNSARQCATSLRRRGHLNAALARRQQMANKIRTKRGLISRSFAEYNISHASDKDVSFGDDELLLFADNSSCVLQPEVTQGPYYIDGELIRYDIREDQAGIPLYLDVQLLDTSTCEPLPAVYVDAWHCNATGVYSGVVASGNGNSNDTTNIDNTFLRGIQQTDLNGVVQFETIVPGHYAGRAPHIHILSHNTNTTLVRTNHTLLGANYANFTTHSSHVGQIFFDQDLLSTVGTTEPYASNTQSLTLNSADDILASETEAMDPFVEYIQVNPDDLADGILAWITLGIDPHADYETSSAGTNYATGGVANAKGGLMGGGGPGGGAGAPPNGTASGSGLPSGASSDASVAMPSGTPPA